MVTQNALEFIGVGKPDFAFVYLGLTDSAGHEFGWMGEKNIGKACRQSLDEASAAYGTFHGRVYDYFHRGSWWTWPQPWVS